MALDENFVGILSEGEMGMSRAMTNISQKHYLNTSFGSFEKEIFLNHSTL